MKKILSIIILSMLCTASAGASEIFGQISTNPNAPSGPENNPPAEEPLPVIKNNHGAVILLEQNKQTSEPEEKQIAAPKAEVLGAKIYPDGALLRGADHKIYLIQGQIKKHIHTLKELEKYRGRAIIEASEEKLSQYQDREHLDGELIRQLQDVKVYVIIKGRKKHILNLEELRAHYFGLEIFNISREEMELY